MSPTGSGIGWARLIARAARLSARISSAAFLRVGALRAFSGESFAMGGGSNLSNRSSTACTCSSIGIPSSPLNSGLNQRNEARGKGAASSAGTCSV